MSRFCFVTFEIHPTTWGGTGVLLSNVTQVLLNKGHEVVLLLDVSAHEFKRFQEHDRLAYPNAENCRAYHVSQMCDDIPYSRNDFISSYTWNSYRFHHACLKIYQLEKPDIIEFFDYCGVAYYALSAKVCSLGYENTHLTVRIHNSNEVMNTNDPQLINFDYYTQYDLEHHALRLAETALFPSSVYFEKAYKPHYPELWFGNQIRSIPPLVSYPHKENSSSEQNIVLFLSRLYSFKGVDKFVDAAVVLLSAGQLTSYKFFLIGHDSMRPPTGITGQSYKEYLLQKIPPQYQDKFIFTDAMSWNEISDLLPRVQFAVFPNYFESFCYAAHELYAAGIPLIVSNIPAFSDYFHHEENALVFKNSVEDLICQMKRLAGDEGLRKKLSCPYPIADITLSGFYDMLDLPSWMKFDANVKRPSLLVCVLDESGNAHNVQKTLSMLDNARVKEIRVLLLKQASSQPSDNKQAFAWLGQIYKIYDLVGKPIVPADARTAETLLILQAGDLPEPEFLQRSLDILGRQPQAAFVGCWRGDKNNTKGDHRVKLVTFPLDAMLEIAPFQGIEPFNRCVMRTDPGKLIVDLFDPRCGRYGEMLYLWTLDDGKRCGLIIPKLLLLQYCNPVEPLPLAILAYFVMQDQHPFRKSRLARYAVAQVQNPSPRANVITNQVSNRFFWLRKKMYIYLNKSRFSRRFLLVPALQIQKLLRRRG